MRYPLLKTLVHPSTTEERRESFGAALTRYIAAGYAPPEAMRATWHDVRIGRAARPRTAVQHVQRWAAGRLRRGNPGRLLDPASKLATLRRIVAEHHALRLGPEGTVDAFTASAILSVYNRLSSANQAKYLAMPVRRMADVAFQLVRSNPRLTGRRGRRVLTVPEQHQLRIARQTLRMHPAMARVMGGPTPAEARRIIQALRNPRTARFCSETLQPKRRYDPRSFRTVVARGHRVTVGCPKGHYAAHGAGRCRHPVEAQRILHPAGEGRCPYGGPRRTRRNPPGRRARLTTFYDRVLEVRGVKGQRSGPWRGRYRHAFTSSPRARGVDDSGWRRMRRGEVVLTGQRPIYDQLKG
jgi:hypothetical protein